MTPSKTCQQNPACMEWFNNLLRAIGHPQAGRQPRWYRKAWTFAKAMFDHVIHGLPYASPEDQAKRWAICEPCEYRRKKDNVCIQCGCNLEPGQMFTKIALARTQCPLLGNRPGPWWPAVKGQTIFAFAWQHAKQRLQPIAGPAALLGLGVVAAGGLIALWWLIYRLTFSG